MPRKPLGRILQNADREPKKHPGIRAPLFDRLISDSETPETGRFYEREELIASIQLEIDRLLNTRTTLKREDYEELAQEPDNYGLPEMYGLPEFALYDGANQNNWPAICRYCAQVISYYEPRLTNVHVEIDNIDRPRQALSLNLVADLVGTIFQGEVTFPLSVNYMASV